MSATSALTVTTNAAASELGPALHDLVAQQIDLHELTRRFLVARIYTLCPVRPGLFVMSRSDGTAIVPVWSSIRALRQAMGDYAWLACTGADLLVQLPAGVGVLIDDGLPCPVVLPSEVLPGQHLSRHLELDQSA